MTTTAARFFLLFALALSTGCNGPVAWFPGGALRGPVAIDDAASLMARWNVEATEVETLELETQPENPYSVRVGFTLKNGQVYIDPAEDRRWYQHLLTDPSVRVRFSTAVYPARAVEVRNATELEGFDPTRHVYRLEITQKP